MMQPPVDPHPRTTSSDTRQPKIPYVKPKLAFLTPKLVELGQFDDITEGDVAPNSAPTIQSFFGPFDPS